MPDRIKETLFNLLRGRMEGAIVLDLFAGTGNVGLEAVSRGARWVRCVERSRAAADPLRENVAALGVEDRTDIVVGDALGPACLAGIPGPVDLVSFDPPYALWDQPLTRKGVMAQMERLRRRLAPDAFVVIRTPWPLPEEVHLHHAGYAGPETRTYKGMALHLYQPIEDEHASPSADVEASRTSSSPSG